MLAVVDPVIATLGAAALAAGGAYWSAVRRFSGKIQTSDATDLWAESKAIREDYKARIADQNEELRNQRGRITELVGEVGRLEARINKIDAQNTELHASVAVHLREIGDLKDKLETCQTSLTVTKGEVDNLTRRLATERQKVSELERRAS